MIVIGAVWVIVYNADLLLGARDARPRPGPRRSPRSCGCRWPIRSRAASGPAPRSRCSRSSSSRSSPAPRPTGRSCRPPSTTSTTFGGGFDVRAGHVGAAPRSPTCAAALRERPGLAADDYPVVASQSVLAVEARQLGTGRPFGDVPRPRPRRRRSSPTRRSGSARSRAATDSAQEVWTALASSRASRSSTASIVPRRDQFGFARAVRTSSSPASTSTRAPFDPVPVAGPRPADRPKQSRLTVIGVLADSAPFEMGGHLDLAVDARPRFPGPRPTRRSTTSRSRPGSTPTAAATGSRGRSSRTGCEAESIQQVVDDAVAANLHLQPADPGLHGARPRRRRRGARRHQRPGRRRAPPADRRDAGDRLPARA